MDQGRTYQLHRIVNQGATGYPKKDEVTMPSSAYGLTGNGRLVEAARLLAARAGWWFSVETLARNHRDRHSIKVPV